MYEKAGGYEMNFSIRTIGSLAQFLNMLGESMCEGILIKYQIHYEDPVTDLPFLIKYLRDTSD